MIATAPPRDAARAEPVAAWQPVPGGVTAAHGLLAGSTTAGLRSRPTPDLALLAVDGAGASAAGVFTTNRFRAAPVQLAETALVATGGHARGVVINAGCANAGTGAAGLADAERVVAAAARRLGCPVEQVLPASTGLIGSRLPVEPIDGALSRIRLSGSRAAARGAARAIMTTDTRPKESAVAVALGGGRTVRIGGMAKGAGMIHPQMATMLAFVATDAAIEPPLLRELLTTAVAASFNQVSVDGDGSTNDAVLLLATGAADGATLAPESQAAARFAGALGAVCRDLARQIAADGEGARTLIEVEVAGARDDAEARLVARAVAASNLVKAAVHGGDPNWGRIACAAGYSGAELDPERLTVSIGPLRVFAGEPLPYDERRASRLLRGRTVRLGLDLGIGDGRGEAWGCDLSAEYVAINSEYRT
ncbi:MAG TPA: bifunctional glutamate N-acetyltransferase/amino-acid acetyltransferase ArgJ [Candidatus Limnocylindria bacterium]|nr:bifunctional glutamate N-acetyltransferase/amino-acid acetyltransferase ArgJ [Candidatus Limnocylindria bacterium]